MFNSLCSVYSHKTPVGQVLALCDKYLKGPVTSNIFL